MVLINTWLDFEVFTTHHILPREEKLVVTRADSTSRRVYELNAEPAAEEYARLIGVPVSDLDHRLFAAHPWRCVSTNTTTCARSKRSTTT